MSKLKQYIRASGVKLEERHVSADGMSTRTLTYAGDFVLYGHAFQRYETPWGYLRAGSTHFHAYIRDYQGKVVGGLPHDDATGVSVNRRKFGGKEYMTESGLNELDYGARHMLPQYGCFTSPDPKAIENTAFSPWAYCNGDPVNNTDPTGMSVIYRLNGDYIGHSSEGFNGEVLIYTGSENVDFSKLTQGEAFEKYPFDLYTFDEKKFSTCDALSGKAMSKIWTHLVSHFEGMQVYDEVFSMSTIPGGVISFNAGYAYKTNGNSSGSVFWGTTHGEIDGKRIFTGIVGTGLYEYETTVENIAASVIVHEWYTHAMKGAGDQYRSHRLAYKNVINFKKLWVGTTSQYKSFVLAQLLEHTKLETGRKQVAPLYRPLFNRYRKHN